MSLRVKAFWLHLLLSTLLLAGFAALVLFVWYKPWPIINLQGGGKILAMMMAIDVVLGPSLTLLVFKPEKSRRMLIFDMSVIFTVQLLAFSYGAWTLQTERPLFLSFDQDRLFIVRGGDINLAKLPKPVANPSFFQSAELVNINLPSEKKMTRLLFRINNENNPGFALYAEYYQPFPGPLTAEQLAKNALPFAEVMKTPETANKINDFLVEHQLKTEEVLLFPIFGRTGQGLAVMAKAKPGLLGLVEAKL